MYVVTSSPLQLFNILQNSDRNDIKKILIFDNKEFEKLYLTVINHFQVQSEHITFRFSGDVRSLVINRKEILLLLKELSNSKVIIGSFFNYIHLLSSSAAKEVELFDDGTETLYLAEWHNKRKLKLLLINLLFLVVYQCVFTAKKITLKTFFYNKNLKPIFKKVIKLNTNVDLGKKNSYNNKCYIVLSPLVEYGIISEETFFTTLDQLICKIVDNNLVPVIIPHRFTSVGLKSILEKKYENIRLLDTGKPLEIFFMTLNSYPQKIFSFGSTFSLNAALLFSYYSENNHVICFKEKLANKAFQEFQKTINFFKTQEEIVSVNYVEDVFNF